GIDRLRGRLYRVRYKDTPRAGNVDLRAETYNQLIDRLKHPNIYYRETAQRLLIERTNNIINSHLKFGDRTPLEEVMKRIASEIESPMKSLNAIAANPKSPKSQRRHSVWFNLSMTGLGHGADANFYKPYVSSEDALIRAWGVRSLGAFAWGIERPKW